LINEGLVGLLVTMLLVVLAQAVDQPFRDGGDKYAAEDYQAAVDIYRDALEAAETPTPELLHNLAAAYYKLGDYAEARDYWVRAAALSDEHFEAQCRFNLGNIDYREALAAQQADANAAMEHLRGAIEQYLDSLQLDRGRGDTRVNLELAYQLLRQLEQQCQNQEQDPNQPQDSNQEQDPNQPQDPNQNQQQNPDPNQQQEPQRDPNQQQDPNNANQQQDQSSGGDQSDQQDSQQQDSEQQDSDQQDSESGEQEQDQQGEGSEQQQGEGEQSQEESGEQQSEAEQQEGQQQPGEAQTANISQQEAEQLLQMVRQREQDRREALRARAAAAAAKQRKVERDW
jgi:Ca-activated chloride channel family protein